MVKKSLRTGNRSARKMAYRERNRDTCGGCKGGKERRAARTPVAGDTAAEAAVCRDHDESVEVASTAQ